MSKRRKAPAPKERTQDTSQQTTLPGMEGGVQWKDELLSTGDLFSGQPYQRPVKERVVEKLVREWDPRLLTPLVVSYRDGRYNLVDGQHRACGARMRNGGKDVVMLCQVYTGLTYEQEAELYCWIRPRDICGCPTPPKPCWNPAVTRKSPRSCGFWKKRALLGHWTSPPANPLRSRPPGRLSMPTGSWAARLFPGCWG